MSWAEAADELPAGVLPPPRTPGAPDLRKTRRFKVAAARELLIRTAELPGSKRELMSILREYRAALHAFAVEGDSPH